MEKELKPIMNLEVVHVDQPDDNVKYWFDQKVFVGGDENYLLVRAPDGELYRVEAPTKLAQQVRLLTTVTDTLPKTSDESKSR